MRTNRRGFIWRFLDELSMVECCVEERFCVASRIASLVGWRNLQSTDVSKRCFPVLHCRFVAMLTERNVRIRGGALVSMEL